MKKSAKKTKDVLKPRRDFLKSSGLVAVSLGNPMLPLAFQALAAAKSARAESADDTAFVYVFLRGGADGLSILSPTAGHPDRKTYEEARPNIKLEAGDVNPLGNNFGLNKACENLLGLYTNRQASFYHGVGNRSSNSRSHFIQQDFIDRGGIGSQADGYLNRLLSLREPGQPAIIASSASPNLSKALIGTQAKGNNLIIPFAKLNGGTVESGQNELSLYGRFFIGSGLTSRLLATWSQGEKSLGKKAVSSSELLNQSIANAKNFKFGDYGSLGQFETAARLLVGCPTLKFLTIDVEGWDTHDVMGPKNGGYFQKLLASFDKAIGQFVKDLENRRNVRIVIISEFGRPLRENGTLGLDHGRGGLAITIGPKNDGGKIVAEQLNLKDLEDDRDIKVNIDHRELIGSALIKSKLVSSDMELATAFPQSEEEKNRVKLVYKY